MRLKSRLLSNIRWMRNKLDCTDIKKAQPQLRRRFVAQRSLRKVIVGERHIAFKGRLQILARAKARGGQDVTDAAVEALDHAAGGRGKSVLLASLWSA